MRKISCKILTIPNIWKISDIDAQTVISHTTVIIEMQGTENS